MNILFKASCSQKALLLKALIVNDLRRGGKITKLSCSKVILHVTNPLHLVWSSTRQAYVSTLTPDSSVDWGRMTSEATRAAAICRKRTAYGPELRQAMTLHTWPYSVNVNSSWIIQTPGVTWAPPTIYTGKWSGAAKRPLKQFALLFLHNTQESVISLLRAKQIKVDFFQNSALSSHFILPECVCMCNLCVQTE